MSEQLKHVKRDKIGVFDYLSLGETSINQLKSYDLIKKIDYGENGKKKVDGLLYKNSELKAIVEWKTNKTLNQKSIENIINDRKNLLKQLQVILIITDGEKSYYYNSNCKLIKDENDECIRFPFKNENDESLSLFLEEFFDRHIHSFDEKLIKKSYIDPTTLSKRIWQIIWQAKGASPENCLYSFVELFIFKYMSDLGILTGMYSFDNVYSSLFDINEENIEEIQVLNHYAKVIRPEMKKIFPQSQNDKTTIINGSVFVSKDNEAIRTFDNVFKSIIKEFYDFGTLKNIHPDFKTKLFETFLKESITVKNWGQYFTPLKVVQAIVKMVNIREGMKICDPACGVGKFLLEAIKPKINDFYKMKNEKLIKKIEIKGFDKGFDSEEQKTIILAKANMLLYFSDLIKANPTKTLEFAKLFNESFELKIDNALGTLSMPPKEEYDLIITNPPYVTDGSGIMKQEIMRSGLSEFYQINGLGIESLFLEWIVRSIKPNAQAFIIVPDGIMNRINDKKIRDFISDNCFVEGIISLPNKTFFTTIKKTYILILRKKKNKSENQSFPIFCFLASSIGETLDHNRFDIVENDLLDAANLFNQFKGIKSNFLFNNIRCKLIKPMDIINSEDWIIEKHWTTEEKMKLGIIENSIKMDLEDFPDFVDSLYSNLKNIGEELRESNIEISELKKGDNLKFRDFPLSELFNFQKGDAKYTLKYIQNNQGNFPVFSSKTANKGIIGRINTYDFDEECITWTTDGIYAGEVFYRNEKFSMTTHCAFMKLKSSFKNKISYEYIYSYLKQNLKSFSVGETGNKRLGVTKIKSINIPIPINKNDDFDIYLQNSISKSFVKYLESKQYIELELNNFILKNIDINFKNGEYVEVELKSILDLEKSKANPSWFTKSFINHNKGSIPVYGATKEQFGKVYGYVKDNIKGIKYYSDTLTWNIDGSIGCHFRSGKFTLSEKVVPLFLKEEYLPIIDKNYLSYAIYDSAITENFTFSKKPNKTRISKLKIKIPVDKDGKINKNLQKSIFENISKIEEIKNDLKHSKNQLKKVNISTF